MTKAEILAKILDYIKITHHSKGRLRLDISSKIRDVKELEGQNFDDVFNINGINEVKVNKILGKVTILYDAEVIEPNKLDNLINAKDKTQIANALKELKIDAWITYK